MKYGLTEKQLAEIIDSLRSFPEIEEAVLFGSRAIDTFKEASDVDIALKGERVTAALAAKLKFELEEETYLPFFFDFIAFPTITNEALREHINTRGVVIFRRGWRECKLGQLIEKKRAGLQTGPFGTMLNAREYRQEGTPVIAVQDIGANKLEYHKFVYVNETTADRLLRYRVMPGDILFGRKGAVDRRALIKPSEAGWIQGSDCIRVRFDDSIDSTFISYQFGSNSYKEWMHQNSSGATMPSLNQQILKLLPITLPPLSEQKAISSVLSSLDDKIDLLHRQNKTLEAIAETLLRQWFVEEAQEDWDDTKLELHVDAFRGLSYKGSGLVEKSCGVPMHNLNSVLEGGGYKYEGIKFYNGEYKERHLITPGDLIVANTEQGHEFKLIGFPAVVPNSFGNKGLFTQHLYKISPNKQTYLSIEFIYHLLMTPSVREQIISATNGSTVNMLSIDGLQRSEFKLPPKEKVVEFTSIVKEYWKKKCVNHKQIRTLETLRDALLPKLMSGEVRVTV